MNILPRPIKFKVWDTKTKQFRTEIPPFEWWLDTDSWDDAEELWNDPWLWQSAPTFHGRMIWCQYLGVNDKDGTEIYEYDVVDNGAQSEYAHLVGVVRYNPNVGAFVAYNGKSGFTSMILTANVFAGKSKVLGSYLEHPELIKFENENND